ncbi:MAG: helicase-related protein [Limnothrix sp.]
MLNEGVDVPNAKIAIILSGTGSSREYIQRLGRVLRKGNSGTKSAILYELVAKDTSEEQVSQRRRSPQKLIQKQNNISPLWQQDFKAAESPKLWREEE